MPKPLVEVQLCSGDTSLFRLMWKADMKRLKEKIRLSMGIRIRNQRLVTAQGIILEDGKQLREIVARNVFMGNPVRGEGKAILSLTLVVVMAPCSFCGERNESRKNFTCERCGTVYCGRMCQLEDWPSHRSACR
jgi:hypothetical protein